MNSSTSSFSIKKTLICIIIGAASFLVFDRLLFTGLMKLETSMYKKESHFLPRFEKYALKKKYDTLLFGTSRAYEAFRPDIFKTDLKKNAYKAAQFGKGPKYNYYFYKEFKKIAGKPEMVVYGIDYFLFNVKSNKRWLARFNKIHDNISFTDKFSLLMDNKHQIEDFLNNSMIKFKEKLQGKGPDKSHDFVAVQKHKGIVGMNKVRLKPANGRFNRTPYKHFPGNEGKYFDRLLEELFKDQVKVVLVIIPDFWGTWRTNFQQKKLIHELIAFQKKYSNIEILNYNHPARFPLRKVEYFADGGYGKTNCHMSASGASFFTKMLTKEIAQFYIKTK